MAIECEVKISVQKEGIRQEIDTCSMLYAPKDVYVLIRKFQDALFEWHKLTGKSVDDPDCD